MVLHITEVCTTPLLVRNKEPYHWAHGTTYGAEVILVEVLTGDGVKGYGESIASPDSAGVEAFIRTAARHLVGQSVFDSRQAMRRCYHALFQAHGTCSAPRFGGQVLAGLEMAMWDAAGKTAGCAVHELLGGKVRQMIEYFGFIQGESPQSLAADAARLVSNIVMIPDLALTDGRLPVLSGPGLGFEIDSDAVARAAEAHRLTFNE